MSAPPNCPVCGEDLSPNAKACPECGADERSGWNEEALIYDGLDLPDEAWEDDDTYSNNRPSRDPNVVAPGWRLIAALLFFALIWWVLSGIF